MDIKNIDTESVGGGFVVGSMLWLYLKRIFRKSADETAATTSAIAQTEVINMLREEVRRMAEANRDLSQKFTDAQHEIMMLRGEILELNGDINRMKEQMQLLNPNNRW